MSEAQPKHFVFVPGSFHGAWCWFKMQPLLGQSHNTSVAIDLPAHGLNMTPVKEVSLDSYVDAVCAVLKKYEQPVTLIGHSRAGIVISQVAERMPDKIERLVYLCAFLIPNGQPMVATALADPGSLLGPNLIFNEAEGWHFPKPAMFKEIFYNDCSDEDTALCQSLLTNEPNAPVGTPLQLTESNFGRVKKTYILTKLDKAISYPHQQMMVNRMPVDDIYTINAGHSPFFSQPQQLADILLQ